jgi:hypothetical protein
MLVVMTTWDEISNDAPELAAKVQARFQATGLGFIATLRKDGSPRISGIEPLFADGQLWLGMMDDSLKAHDLLRDPRFALHSASVDKQVTDGDAKLGGRAVAVDPDAIDPFRKVFAAHTGYEPPPGPFHLFTADVTEMSFLAPAGDHLVIESVVAGGQPKRIERR